MRVACLHVVATVTNVPGRKVKLLGMGYCTHVRIQCSAAGRTASAQTHPSSSNSSQAASHQGSCGNAHAYLNSSPMFWVPWLATHPLIRLGGSGSVTVTGLEELGTLAVNTGYKGSQSPHPPCGFQATGLLGCREWRVCEVSRPSAGTRQQKNGIMAMVTQNSTIVSRVRAHQRHIALQRNT